MRLAPNLPTDKSGLFLVHHPNFLAAGLGPSLQFAEHYMLAGGAPHEDLLLFKVTRHALDAVHFVQNSLHRRRASLARHFHRKLCHTHRALRARGSHYNATQLNTFRTN
eukprot:GHVT01088567.1.p1 GENE.GHVT01088567.1~~GHVT01088567.1.p1  ORF type:complete len:109 (+),score=12.05 GHVT01088567.1:451-777(+)